MSERSPEVGTFNATGEITVGTSLPPSDGTHQQFVGRTLRLSDEIAVFRGEPYENPVAEERQRGEPGDPYVSAARGYTSEWACLADLLPPFYWEQPPAQVHQASNTNNNGEQ